MTARTRRKTLVRPDDPLALKRLLDRLLDEAGDGMSATVRGHLAAARQAALDEFMQAEASTLGTARREEAS